jgi:hypothetical protein
VASVSAVVLLDGRTCVARRRLAAALLGRLDTRTRLLAVSARRVATARPAAAVRSRVTATLLRRFDRRGRLVP